MVASRRDVAVPQEMVTVSRAGKELRRLERAGKIRIPEARDWIGTGWGIRTEGVGSWKGNLRSKGKRPANLLIYVGGESLQEWPLIG